MKINLYSGLDKVVGRLLNEYRCYALQKRVDTATVDYARIEALKYVRQRADDEFYRVSGVDFNTSYMSQYGREDTYLQWLDELSQIVLHKRNLAESMLQDLNRRKTV